MHSASLGSMSTQWMAFVAALGETATCKYIVDVNTTCASLRVADAVARRPPAALQQRLIPLLQVPPQLIPPTPAGSNSTWSAAKIFEVVLWYLDVSATDSSLLVTRTFFPWAEDPANIPARLASNRTMPHPAAPGGELYHARRKGLLSCRSQGRRGSGDGGWRGAEHPPSSTQRAPATQERARG